MSEKKLPKAKLDWLIVACAAFYSATCDAKRECAWKEVSRASKAISPDSFVRVYALQDLITGIVRLSPDATKEDVYKVLEVLGWTVE